MPIYDFKCPVCSTLTPVKAAVDEDFTPPGCPYCMVIMERIWTATPAHFKGRGWGSDK